MTEKNLTFEKSWILILAISSVALGFLEFHGFINEFCKNLFEDQNNNLQEESLSKTFN